MNYPNVPTGSAQVDSTKFDSELLGKNDLGTVHIHGPFGDVNSDVKIAYVIGMHPLESKSHRALFDVLINQDNLKYCYYLYNINANVQFSKTEGRLEGQKLAQEFIQEEIINKKYDLFLDIHSNRGPDGPGNYEITNFVFAPGFDEISKKYASEIIKNIGDIVYYVPEHRTSPPFITEPTSNAGIPTIVYECYSYESFDKTMDLAYKLVETVDGIDFF